MRLIVGCKMAAGTDKLECPQCKIHLNDNDKALQCDGLCDTWHHIKCVEM